LNLSTKYLAIILIIVLIFQINPAQAAQEPYISADAAVLMDAHTGQVLFAKNPHKKRPPASTTKIMTALLALELGDPDEIVTVSPGAAAVGESSIYLDAGEKLKLSDLVFGALLKSGNDACAAIAEHIGGSIEGFAALMNKKAYAIGARHTHFVNPHGLPAKGHLTTAYDLGLIAVHALKNAKFSEIVSTREQIIDWYGKSWDRKLKNTNKLLWRYHWADGVKTGTTREAGQCLVSSASKDSRRLVAVVLKSGDRYGDTVRLFEYGFANFEYRQVAVAGEIFRSVPVQDGIMDSVPVRFTGDLALLVPKDRPEALEIRSEITHGLKAPVQKGRQAGWVKVYLDGQLVGRSDLAVVVDVPERTWWEMFKRWWGEKKIKGILSIFSN
jgi:D-alanyl-D-alanine carboxypeptidase (penicillin-binding protein 5/6)